MKNILVYRHRTLDTHEVFYIGIGSLKRSKTKHNRSSYWNNIVNKHGYYIEIIQEGLNWEEASRIFNIEYSKLKRCLNGKVKSKIKFKYY